MNQNAGIQQPQRRSLIRIQRWNTQNRVPASLDTESGNVQLIAEQLVKPGQIRSSSVVNLALNFVPPGEPGREPSLHRGIH